MNDVAQLAAPNEKVWAKCQHILFKVFSSFWSDGGHRTMDDPAVGYSSFFKFAHAMGKAGKFGIVAQGRGIPPRPEDEGRIGHSIELAFSKSIEAARSRFTN
jgi:hypothetical protein